MRIGLLQVSQIWIRGDKTFSPMRLTGWSQDSRSIGAGGPLSSVVKVGASSDDMSQSWSSGKGSVNGLDFEKVTTSVIFFADFNALVKFFIQYLKINQNDKTVLRDASRL